MNMQTKGVGAIVLFLLLFTGLPAAARAQAQVPWEREYLFELLRYLYRWHLDDAILAGDVMSRENWTVRYRELEMNLDAGDASRFVELVFPEVNLVVTLKRADYQLEKSGHVIRNRHFKVQSVHYYPQLEWDSTAYEVVSYGRDEIFEYLLRTRNVREFPSEAVRQRLRREALAALDRRQAWPDPGPEGEQSGYVAPVSIVSSDLWFFWVEGNRLFRFTTDTDVLEEGYWERAAVNVEIIDLHRDVIISPLERPNANRIYTKDFIGRVLYNCVVLGELVVDPGKAGP